MHADSHTFLMSSLHLFALVVIQMKFMKLAQGSFHPFHMKWPFMQEPLYNSHDIRTNTSILSTHFPSTIRAWSDVSDDTQYAPTVPLLSID